MNKLSISILDIEVEKMSEKLEELRCQGIRNIHLDIIDTSFTSNISFGISTINYILSFEFNFDIHFMIKNPMKIIEKLKIKNGTKLTVHSEEFLEIPGYRIGIALNPDESIEKIQNFVHKVSHVLVMGVEPGQGGQTFMSSCISKIHQLKSLGICVGVDGGINKENIRQVKDADFIVVGSYITKSENIVQSLSALIQKLT